LFFFSQFWTSDVFQSLMFNTGSRDAATGAVVTMVTAAAAGFCVSLSLLSAASNRMETKKKSTKSETITSYVLSVESEFLAR